MKLDDNLVSYIENEYRIVKNEYRLSSDDESKQKALREMHRLTTLAALKFGFEYADRLTASSFS